jgi:hypothetical protein
VCISGLLNHAFQILLAERFEQFGMLVHFLQAQLQFRADIGRNSIGLAREFVPVLVKPPHQLRAFRRRQRPDAGFNLLHAHGSKFTAPGVDCESKVARRLPALVAQVLQKIFDERLHFRRFRKLNDWSFQWIQEILFARRQSFANSVSRLFAQNQWSLVIAF